MPKPEKVYEGVPVRGSGAPGPQAAPSRGGLAPGAGAPGSLNHRFTPLPAAAVHITCNARPRPLPGVLTLECLQ